MKRAASGEDFVVVALRPRSGHEVDHLVPLPPGVSPGSQLARDMASGFFDYLLPECSAAFPRENAWKGPGPPPEWLEALRRWEDVGTRYRYAQDAEDARLAQERRALRSAAARRAAQARVAAGDPEGPRATHRAERAKRNVLIHNYRVNGLGPTEIARALARHHRMSVHKSTVSRVLKKPLQP